MPAQNAQPPVIIWIACVVVLHASLLSEPARGGNLWAMYSQVSSEIQERASNPPRHRRLPGSVRRRPRSITPRFWLAASACPCGSSDRHRSSTLERARPHPPPGAKNPGGLSRCSRTHYPTPASSHASPSRGDRAARGAASGKRSPPRCDGASLGHGRGFAWGMAARSGCKGYPAHGCHRVCASAREPRPS